MNITVIGISHKTASVDAREKFCLSNLEREMLLSSLKNDPSVVEAIVISTCNRTEVYASFIDQERHGEILIEALFKVKNIPLNEHLKKYFYILSGNKCIKHFLNVATSLDSLVLGEKQILGQIKTAIEVSRDKGMMSKQFNVLSDIVVRAGKKAQHETDISKGGVSVSWAAIKMATKTLKTLKNKSVLIMGAGKMGELTANQLKNKGAKSTYIMNRTCQNGIELAEKVGAKAVSFWEMKDFLAEADVCICSVSAPHYIIELDLVEHLVKERKGRKLVLIDISTPRNIDPKISQLANVELYSIDDLQAVVGKTINKRKAAIKLVEGIILTKMLELKKKLKKIKEYNNSEFVIKDINAKKSVI